jgi:alcohol dehydrogenase
VATGRLVVLGTGKDPLPVATRPLMGGRGVLGSLTGSPCESERTLAFSLLTGVWPMIEVLPQEKAQEACERLKSATHPRFSLGSRRKVLDIMTL